MSSRTGFSRHLGLWPEADLWAHREEDAVRTELVGRFVPFAKSIALRYNGRAESLDDLIQVANLGLMKAIDRFDPGKGHPFMAFASSTINGELKRHFRDRVSTVKLPRSIYERIGEIESVASDLRNSLGREPTTTEIAGYIRCPEEEVDEAVGAATARNPTPLQYEDEDEDGRVLEEHIGTVDDGFELTEDRIAVGEAVGRLGPADRSLLRMRFEEELPQREIGERLGCSQMQVSRRLRRVLDHLGDEAGGDRTVKPA
jgi:RNA polymerase sigma-B factor